MAELKIGTSWRWCSDSESEFDGWSGVGRDGEEEEGGRVS